MSKTENLYYPDIISGEDFNLLHGGNNLYSLLDLSDYFDKDILEEYIRKKNEIDNEVKEYINIIIDEIKTNISDNYNNDIKNTLLNLDKIVMSSRIRNILFEMNKNYEEEIRRLKRDDEEDEDDTDTEDDISDKNKYFSKLILDLFILPANNYSDKSNKNREIEEQVDFFRSQVEEVIKNNYSGDSFFNFIQNVIRKNYNEIRRILLFLRLIFKNTDCLNGKKKYDYSKRPLLIEKTDERKKAYNNLSTKIYSKIDDFINKYKNEYVIINKLVDKKIIKSIDVDIEKFVKNSVHKNTDKGFEITIDKDTSFIRGAKPNRTIDSSYRIIWFTTNKNVANMYSRFSEYDIVKARETMNPFLTLNEICNSYLGYIQEYKTIRDLKLLYLNYISPTGENIIDYLKKLVREKILNKKSDEDSDKDIDKDTDEDIDEDIDEDDYIKYHQDEYNEDGFKIIFLDKEEEKEYKHLKQKNENPKLSDYKIKLEDKSLFNLIDSIFTLKDNRVIRKSINTEDNKLAFLTCRLGFDGWIHSNMYDHHGEILICNSNKNLRFRREETIRNQVSYCNDTFKKHGINPIIYYLVE